MNNMQDPNNPFAGCWIHRETGERIKVKNSIMDGQSMIVLTEDGRQMESSEFSENWFRLDADDEEILQLTEQIKTENKANENIGSEDSRMSVSVEPGRKAWPKCEPSVLDKIFKKARLSFSIDASELSLPIEALKVAMEYLDIEPADIEDYINKHIKIEICGLGDCLCDQR